MATVKEGLDGIVGNSFEAFEIDHLEARVVKPQEDGELGLRKTTARERR